MTHKCEKYDYINIGNNEFIIFCPECRQALGVVAIDIKQSAKHVYDEQTLEELK